jgi:hypothetical protein
MVLSENIVLYSSLGHTFSMDTIDQQTDTPSAACILCDVGSFRGTHRLHQRVEPPGQSDVPPYGNCPLLRIRLPGAPFACSEVLTPCTICDPFLWRSIRIVPKTCLFFIVGVNWDMYASEPLYRGKHRVSIPCSF